MSEKPCRKEDPVWSILPSYDMYQNAFSGGQDPPQYGESASVYESTYTASHLSNDAPTESTAVTSYENLVNIDAPNIAPDPASDDASSASSPSLIIADESTNHWRETLLDNIDNLRNFSSSSNPYTQNVELSVHFTEDVGQPGVAPKHIDPSHFEYKQGDFLNGYVLIKNHCAVSLPFKMFYVLFEGNFTLTGKEHTAKKKQVKVKKYLEMFDFAASWKDSRIERLISENYDDENSCPETIDPIDNAKLYITGRKLEPGVLYKRYFTFKIPERLLDTECNDHHLTSHTALPPTLGLSEKEKLVMGKPSQTSNDFSFSDFSANYSVLARFIGRASDFDVKDKFNLDTKLIDAAGDEYIIFRESCSFIRVIQEALMLNHSEKHVNAETARILYNNLLGRINEKLELGRQIQNTIAAGGSVQDIPSSTHLVANPDDPECAAQKSKNLYTRLDDLTKKSGRHKSEEKPYEITIPIVKKKLLGPVKCQGLFQISSPRTEYLLNYMSPKIFDTSKASNKHLWKLEIPLKVSFRPAEPLNSSKVPHIISIVPELAVFTMKAGNLPVPIEITHDHLFQNKSCSLVDLKSTDNFENIVQTPMKKYGSELCSIVKEVGSDAFKVEKSLLDDIRALAGIQSKCNHLSLRNAVVIENDESIKEVEKTHNFVLDENKGVYSKDFTVVVDATKAQKKTVKPGKLPDDYSSADEFCLVPSFQNCSAARMYYLRLIIRISTGEMLELKLPVTIAKIPSN